MDARTLDVLTSGDVMDGEITFDTLIVEARILDVCITGEYV